MRQATAPPQLLTPLHPNCIFLPGFCIEKQKKNAFHDSDWNEYTYVLNSHRLYFQGFPPQELQLILEHEEHQKQEPTDLVCLT